MPCRFCGKVIRVNMYRHVARLHLDLVQLWRFPIAWCTTWKGSPQDCLEHIQNGHDVRYQRVSRNMPHHGLCVGSCGQSRCGWNIPLFQPTYCCSVSWDCCSRNTTGCTEAVCPTLCFARTTSRDSGLFCHHRDVRKKSQHRRRKPDGGRRLDLPDDYIGFLDRCAECRRRLTMGRF